jgi:hypothetical protein
MVLFLLSRRKYERILEEMCVAKQKRRMKKMVATVLMYCLLRDLRFFLYIELSTMDILWFHLQRAFKTTYGRKRCH